MNEFWKTVIIDGVEHPRYKVSNLGKVKCIDFRGTGKERICKLSVNSSGYLQVKIDGVPKRVHRLVAEAFLPTEGKPCVDHINTNKTSNVVILADDGQTVLSTNLRWATYMENSNNPLTMKHISDNNAKPWLGKFGAENPSSIQIVQLSKDEKFIRKWPAANDVERELGFDHSNIIKCCKGKRNYTGGYKWVYAKDYRKSISQIKPLF